MTSARYDPDIHHRHSIRLKGYDYSREGAYFVTLCVQNRECLFGDVVDREMCVNDAGEMVMKTWADLPNHYGNITLDEFVIMPNHIHGIIVMTNVGAGLKPARPSSKGAGFVRAGLKPAPTKTNQHGLSEIVRALKTFASRRINAIRNTPGIRVWQRNYYEHIIRDEEELSRIREYIVNNPARWAEDEENPFNVKRMMKIHGEHDRNVG